MDSFREGNRSKRVVKEIKKHYKLNTDVWIDSMDAEKIKPRHDWIISQLKNIKKGKLLDVGSWTGEFANSVGNLGFKNTTCIELNEAACALGKKTYSHIDFINADIEEYAFGKNKYDVIMINEVLEHLCEPEKVLQKLKQALAPGGLLLATVPTPDRVFGYAGKADEHISEIDASLFYNEGGHVVVLKTEDDYKWLAASIGNNSKDKLAVIIVNYNTKASMDQLVESFNAMKQDRFDLYIIENGSRHGQRIENAHTTYETNLGWDQATIRFLKDFKHKKKYAGYWMLNSDIVLDPNTNYINNFLKHLSNNRNAGLISTFIEDVIPRSDVPQNQNYGFVSKIGYVDFQSAVLSQPLLDKMTFTNTEAYFHGGLDVDINMVGTQNGFEFILDNTMSAHHLGGLGDRLIPDIVPHTKALKKKFGEIDLEVETWELMVSHLMIAGWKKRYSAEYRDAYKDGDGIYDTAIRFKTKLSGKIPEPYGANEYFAAGLYDMNMGYYNRALEAFTKHPNSEDEASSNLKTNLGLCYYQLGDTEKAEKYLLEAFNSGNWHGATYLIALYNSQEEFRKAADLSKVMWDAENQPEGTTANRYNYEYYGSQASQFNKIKKDIMSFVFYIVPDVARPWDAKNDFKLGGSEIAAINMSRELASLGHDVRVFNRCAEPGTYDNVIWDHFDNFDQYEKENDIDVLIVSRLPEFRFVNPKTKVLFWAHDLNYYNRITTTNWQYFDKFLVLSRYHHKFFSTCYPFIPQDSFDTIPNGINLERFENKDVKRQKKKIIYSSNPDRGLEHLLDWFPELYAWDPEVELHVFSYYPDNITKDPKFFRDIPGVIYRGYVDQDQLAEEYMSSRVWVYPSSWLETFCITAIEAQAAGTPSVVSDYACLRDRVGNAGIVIDGVQKDKKHKDSFLNAIRNLISDDELWEKYSQAGLTQAKIFTWGEAAKRLVEVSRK